MHKNSKNYLFNLAFSGAMTALSCVIIAIFPEITIFMHLKISFCDFPQILLGFICGPAWGIASAFIRCVFQAVYGGFSSFGIGEFINFVLCSCMILSMHFLCKKVFRDPTLSNPAKYYISAIITIFITILAGYLLNIAMLPLFYFILGIGFNSAAYWAAIFTSTSLNALKSAVNILPLYPPAYLALKFARQNGRNPG